MRLKENCFQTCVSPRDLSGLKSDKLFGFIEQIENSDCSDKN